MNEKNKYIRKKKLYVRKKYIFEKEKMLSNRLRLHAKSKNPDWLGNLTGSVRRVST